MCETRSVNHFASSWQRDDDEFRRRCKFSGEIVAEIGR